MFEIKVSELHWMEGGETAGVKASANNLLSLPVCDIMKWVMENGRIEKSQGHSFEGC